MQALTTAKDRTIQGQPHPFTAFHRDGNGTLLKTQASNPALIISFK